MKRRPVPRRYAGLVELFMAGALMSVAAPAVALAAPATPQAHQAQPAAAIHPVVSCASLAGKTFTAGQGTSGKVSSARLVTDKPWAKNVRFCQIGGVITPRIEFGLLLPVSTWHGQYVQEGCSALCGSVPQLDFPDTAITCTAVHNGNLALAADDMGHTGSESDGKWPRNDLLARA